MAFSLTILNRMTVNNTTVSITPVCIMNQNIIIIVLGVFIFSAVILGFELQSVVMLSIIVHTVVLLMVVAVKIIQFLFDFEKISVKEV